jgi:hypothetical protein
LPKPAITRGHLNRASDPEYQAELDERMSARDAGRKTGEAALQHKFVFNLWEARTWIRSPLCGSVEFIRLSAAFYAYFGR